MVLYYKASQRKLEELEKEEKELEEAKRKEKQDKKDLCEPAPKPAEPREVPKPTEDESGDYEEYREEEPKEDNGDEESPETAEEGTPLTLSESRKVTAAEADLQPRLTKWERAWAQVPRFSGGALPGYTLTRVEASEYVLGVGMGKGLAKVVFPRKWQAWPNWPRSHGTGTPFFGTKVEVVCPFVYTAIPSLHQQCPSSLSLTQRT